MGSGPFKTIDMYHLTVNSKDAKLIQYWNEMTLSRADKVYKIMDHMPDKLKEIYQATLREQTPQTKTKLAKLYRKLTTKETTKKFPEFYGKIICALSNISNKEMKYVLHDSRTHIYQLTLENGVSCESVVMGLLGFPYDHDIKPIKNFKWRGETLELPVYKTQFGTEIPMAEEQIITFAEATDLQIFGEQMAEGKYKVMSNIISILCRPKDEEYDEEKSLERAKTMMKLPMDIVWEVFFCTVKQFDMLQRCTWIYLAEEVSKAAGHRRKVA